MAEISMSEGSLTYGFHPVRELLRSQGDSVLEVLVARGRGGQRRRDIEDLCARSGIKVREVPEQEIRMLSRGATHNGFAARSLVTPTEAVAGADPNLRILLEDIQDPRNLGALMRVCEGAGVGRVMVRDRGSAPLTATAAKVSAGASQWLAVERVTNSSREIRTLQDEGFWVYGADAAGKAPWDLDLSGKIVLCMGGEEKGLRANTRKLCDGLVGLPMRGKVESLNVATAASALLYEAVRQRSGS